VPALVDRSQRQQRGREQGHAGPGEAGRDQAPQGAQARGGSAGRFLFGARQADDAAGLVFLFAILFGLSVLAGFKFVRPVKVFVAGEIATQDVKADSDLLIEEAEATRKKRELVASIRPA